jgi:hypothetical protein
LVVSSLLLMSLGTKLLLSRLTLIWLFSKLLVSRICFLLPSYVFVLVLTMHSSRGRLRTHCACVFSLL